MTDICDRASELEERQRGAALRAYAASRRFVAPSPDGTCVSCGDPIPPERLHALPGVARCVECQGFAERGL